MKDRSGCRHEDEKSEQQDEVEHELSATLGGLGINLCSNKRKLVLLLLFQCKIHPCNKFAKVDFTAAVMVHGRKKKLKQTHKFRC